MKILTIVMIIITMIMIIILSTICTRCEHLQRVRGGHVDYMNVVVYRELGWNSKSTSLEFDLRGSVTTTTKNNDNTNINK